MTKYIAIGLFLGLIIGSMAWAQADDKSHSITGGGPGSASRIVLVPFTFANIAGVMNTNGSIGYCSDCLVQSTCASGGTGTIVKRLNGANVCN